jgi:glucan phosphoethanolaminetransferase (alkaline phosphatase superfamily)
MKKSQSYYGYNFNKNQIKTGYGKYTPGTVGKIAMAVTIPSALIALISVLVALFVLPEALIVTLVTFIISFVGSIVIMADIVIFNHKQKKSDSKSDEVKQPDIMRIVHMLIGIVVGIIIGYLIWGAKYQ